jgi:hypothetical protein
MPYVSDKQRKYFNWAAAHGKMAQSMVDEYNEASKGKKLPEKVNKKNRFKRTMKKLEK